MTSFRVTLTFDEYVQLVRNRLYLPPGTLTVNELRKIEQFYEDKISVPTAVAYMAKYMEAGVSNE